ncbi:signal peptidase I [Rhodococcus hoagii]|uniref:Signal peptidase I n=1 Tax=Rhodococcus hoagii TaxID=43767 RepID=A0AAE4ZLQ5_RHOHA|nr:signal peptidase I [Prescottella equi]NKS28398.1 signal peptidase I [Prescottella equi]
MSDHEMPPNRHAMSGKVLREAALTVGAIAGLICIVATIAAMLFGIKPLIFRSGSMSPEITTGSLALSRKVPATDLKVGDIVSVQNTQGTRITHRVYELQSQSGDTVIVTLKGDANQDPDAEPYVIHEADRVFTSVGGLGYTVAWLSSPIAIFLGGAFVGVLLMIVVRPARKNNDSDDDQSPGADSPIDDAVDTEFVPVIESKVEPMSPTQRFSAPSARSILVFVAAALSVLGLTQATGTAAAFTDAAVATSGTLAINSSVLPNIAPPTCALTGLGGTNGTATTFKHLGYPFAYKATLYDNSMNVKKQDYASFTPAANVAKGTNYTINVNYGDVGYTFGEEYFYLRIFTVNQLTNEKSTEWRGHSIRKPGSQAQTKCGSQTASANPTDPPMSAANEMLQARLAIPEEAPSTSTPVSAVSTTAPSSTTTPSTATTTTSTTSNITTTTTTSTASASATTPSPTPDGTTPESTTTTSSTATTPIPTTSSTVVDTPLGASRESQSRGYSALLVKSPTTSQTAIVIADSNGEELKRLSVAASAQYEWDTATDTLWIVDGGQLYKASGSSWTKTSVDPSSSDVPADIAPLVE